MCVQRKTREVESSESLSFKNDMLWNSDSNIYWACSVWGPRSCARKRCDAEKLDVVLERRNRFSFARNTTWQSKLKYYTTALTVE